MEDPAQHGTITLKQDQNPMGQVKQPVLQFHVWHLGLIGHVQAPNGYDGPTPPALSLRHTIDSLLGWLHTIPTTLPGEQSMG